MWITDDGRLHTVSPEDPALVVGDAVVALVSSLSRRKAKRLLGDLEVLEDEFYTLRNLVDQLDTGPEWVGALPTTPVLTQVDDAQDLVSQLGRVELRWRLDAIAAVEDALDLVS